MTEKQLVRCPSCDGYGWFAEENVRDRSEDCTWCGGIGYVERDERGVDRPIPASKYPELADALEQLDEGRLRELGYSGVAKPRPTTPNSS